MNGVELFLLGRTLMKIGERALPTEGLGTYSTSVGAVLTVLIDIVEHPDSAVGEISVRTGLPQSRVSGAIARLREGGSVVAAPDPADRRRLLVRQAPDVSERAALVAATGIDDALATALDTDDDAEVDEVAATLEALARRLTPATLHRIRSQGGDGSSEPHRSRKSRTNAHTR